MHITTRLGLSTAALLLSAGGALAADLVIYDPAPAAMPVYEAEGGMYVSLFGGAAFINDFEFESTLNGGTDGVIESDTGYSLDAALGYDFGNGLSVEGQVGYLNAELNGASFNDNPIDLDGSSSITYGMLNAWYGFDLGGITPFIGGGVGLASVAVDGEFDTGSDTTIDDSSVTWAAQVGAGVSLELADNIALTGRYRYLMTGDVTFDDSDGDENTGSASASIVDVGLKFSF